MMMMPGLAEAPAAVIQRCGRSLQRLSAIRTHYSWTLTWKECRSHVIQSPLNRPLLRLSAWVVFFVCSWLQMFFQLVVKILICSLERRRDQWDPVFNKLHQYFSRRNNKNVQNHSCWERLVKLQHKTMTGRVCFITKSRIAQRHHCFSATYAFQSSFSWAQGFYCLLLFSTVLANQEHIALLNVVLRLCILSISQRGGAWAWSLGLSGNNRKHMSSKKEAAAAAAAVSCYWLKMRLWSVYKSLLCFFFSEWDDHQEHVLQGRADPDHRGSPQRWCFKVSKLNTCSQGCCCPASFFLDTNQTQNSADVLLVWHRNTKPKAEIRTTGGARGPPPHTAFKKEPKVLMQPPNQLRFDGSCFDGFKRTSSVLVVCSMK